MPEVKVKRTVLNSSTPDEGEEHNCAVLLKQTCFPRPDLHEIPLTNPDLILFVNVSSDANTGIVKVGYAVVSHHEVLKSAPLLSEERMQRTGSQKDFLSMLKDFAEAA